MSRRLNKLWITSGSEARSLRSIIPAVSSLIILSFFLIGSCNNSGSGEVDARTIGEIDGVIEPALRQVLTIRGWQEGDPDGHLFLNGDRVATLSGAEQQAINDAYDMGFIVALLEADIDHILDLHEVLGLDPIFADNGTLDLLAISREFNVSGIRYFQMRPFQSEDDAPMPDDLNVDRVVALVDWAPTASSATAVSSVSSAFLELRGTNSFDFTQVADSLSHEQYTVSTPAGDTTVVPAEFKPDFQLVLQGGVQLWSAHSFSSIPPSDFYYVRASYSITPRSTLGPLDSVCNKFCGLLPLMAECPNPSVQKGTGIYTAGFFQEVFAAPTIEIRASAPPSTSGQVTTTSSIDNTIAADVSYSQEEGASVGVSDSTTVSHSTSFSTPAVITKEEIGSNCPLNNNANWTWNVQQSVSRLATFSPSFQLIWEAGEQTRAPGHINMQENFTYSSFPYSCVPFSNTTAFAILNYDFPLPPLPTSCTANSDCSVGQVCGTDFAMPVCSAAPCDESMTCPDGFQCLNEVCQPTG